MCGVHGRSMATSNINLMGVDEVMACTSIFIIFSQMAAILVFRFSPKLTVFLHSRSSLAVSNMNLLWALVSQLRETQALACGGGDGVHTENIQYKSRLSS